MLLSFSVYLFIWFVAHFLWPVFRIAEISFESFLDFYLSQIIQIITNPNWKTFDWDSNVFCSVLFCIKSIELSIEIELYMKKKEFVWNEII